MVLVSERLHCHFRPALRVPRVGEDGQVDVSQHAIHVLEESRIQVTHHYLLEQQVDFLLIKLHLSSLYHVGNLLPLSRWHFLEYLHVLGAGGEEEARATLVVAKAPDHVTFSLHAKELLEELGLAAQQTAYLVLNPVDARIRRPVRHDEGA